MSTSLLVVRSEDGRTLRGLLDRPPSGSCERGVVVLVPGFGRTAVDYAPLALALLANGLATLRFDARDHVGASDGEIKNFSLSGVLADLDAMVQHARRGLGFSQVAAFATSLGTRVCVRALARGLDLSALVAVSTVVSVRDTLARVVGYDLIGRTLEDPSIQEYEILDEVVDRGFVTDAVERLWCKDADVAQELRAGERCPALWVQGALDPWIDVPNTLMLLGQRRNGQVLVLEDAVHQLNLASLKTVTLSAIPFLCEHLAVPQPEEVSSYRFRDLVSKAKADRALLAGLGDDGVPAGTP